MVKWRFVINSRSQRTNLSPQTSLMVTVTERKMAITRYNYLCLFYVQYIRKKYDVNKRFNMKKLIDCDAIILLDQLF